MSWPSCLSALLQAFQPKWCSSSPTPGHVGPADDLAVGLGVRVDVDHGHRVVALRGPVEGDDVGQLLGRSGGGVGGRPVERRVHGGCVHEESPPPCWLVGRASILG